MAAGAPQRLALWAGEVPHSGGSLGQPSPSAGLPRQPQAPGGAGARRGAQSSPEMTYFTCRAGAG